MGRSDSSRSGIKELIRAPARYRDQESADAKSSIRRNKYLRWNSSANGHIGNPLRPKSLGHTWCVWKVGERRQCTAMEGSMLRPKMLPVILVVVSAVTVLTARASLSEPQAQECKTAPGASTPRGGHWHYRINRTDKQRCWYLSPADARANGRATAALASTPVPARQKRNASPALPAEPPQAAAAESTAGDKASAPTAPAEVAFLRPSSDMRAKGERDLVRVGRTILRTLKI